ncbi:MAG: DUF4350 domain-containing protein [Methanobacterium sp.]
MGRNFGLNFKSLKRAFIVLLLFLILFSFFNAVSAQENKKILFDESNPTFGKLNTIHSIGTYGSSGFANLLQENGYSVSALKDTPITPEKLKGYDVLIIMAQSRNYTDEEIQTIKNFVNNGGGLLLIGNTWGKVDGDQNFAFNKIAKSFGVSFAYNEVVTNDQNYFLLPYNIDITDLKPSKITSNIKNYYHLSGTYIKEPGPSTIVAYTDSNSWGDKGHTTPEGTTDSNYKKDPDETSGLLPVISQMEYGKGKVVFMGSSEAFINSLIYQSDAWKMGLNSVNWLANNPAPQNYNPSSIIPLNLLLPQILLMIILGAAVISGLAFKVRRDRKLEESRTIKTIKNWKFKGLIVSNVIFTLVAVILFIPINFYLFDFTNLQMYEPNLGYTLIITGILFIFFMVVILFNLIARQRLIINYSYINLAIVILFAGLTVILGDIYGFPIMQIFTLGGFALVVPMITNLWIHRGYGQDLIIEGREFDRLKKLSTKSLPFELQPFFSDAAYIGEGGFGRVFKAINKEGKEVALKIPKSFDKRAERSFITEVSNWSHLDNPHIVKLLGYKILPIPYIETEFCEERLDKGIKTLDEAVSIIYDIAKGLEYAHNKNIIHGDIKLSNILIKNGVYKISDWGLSKLMMDESVTLSGATPSYCAPEQISVEYGRADERTDIYQLGNIFYELITGRMPFEGNISQLYSSILTNKPVNPSKINSNAKPVDEIIMKCLSKNKEDRYSSMRVLIDELEKYRPADETLRFD